MSLDRAIMLPHEFNKKEYDPPTGGIDTRVPEVLHSPTGNSMKRSQEAGERARDEPAEKL